MLPRSSPAYALLNRLSEHNHINAGERIILQALLSLAHHIVEETHMVTPENSIESDAAVLRFLGI